MEWLHGSTCTSRFPGDCWWQDTLKPFSFGQENWTSLVVNLFVALAVVICSGKVILALFESAHDREKSRSSRKPSKQGQVNKGEVARVVPEFRYVPEPSAIQDDSGSDRSSTDSIVKVRQSQSRRLPIPFEDPPALNTRTRKALAASRLDEDLGDSGVWQDIGQAECSTPRSAHLNVV